MEHAARRGSHQMVIGGPRGEHDYTIDVKREGKFFLDGSPSLVSSFLHVACCTRVVVVVAVKNAARGGPAAGSVGSPGGGVEVSAARSSQL